MNCLVAISNLLRRKSTKVFADSPISRRFAVPANDHRQRRRQSFPEQIGDRRHPAVQDDVAGFRQRTSSKLSVSGKINSASERERPVEVLRTATKLRLLPTI
jgi:hypothetical protein